MLKRVEREQQQGAIWRDYGSGAAGQGSKGDANDGATREMQTETGKCRGD